MRQNYFRKQVIELQMSLSRFALMLTANQEDADDLLQDTTLKAFLHEGTYVDKGNLKAWLFTIMRNIFINNYRRVISHQTKINPTEESLKEGYNSDFNSLEDSFFDDVVWV